MSKIIEPSLLALSKINPEVELEQIKKLGLKYVHYDVMDEEFIGHESFITQHLDWLAKNGIYSNVHLMVDRPLDWIVLYKPYLVNAITFHCETQNAQEAKHILDQIHDLGFKAGLAVKMGTDLNDFKELANDCDIITVMSVEPGLGGQKYSEQCIHNLKVCKEWKKINNKLIVQIDGGINDQNMVDLLPYVDNFITGSWFFTNIDKIPEVIKMLSKY